MISKELIPFLIDLGKHNNKLWFERNKEHYLELKNDFEKFVGSIIPHIALFEKDLQYLNAKQCIFRIYRDARFSHNKQPYKTNFGAEFSKGGRRSMYASYYVHIEPGQCFAGGGMYMPEPDVLKAVRKEIFLNPDEFKGILEKRSFKKMFGVLEPIEVLKKAPKGFPDDFKDIDLLKHKHYIVSASFSDSDISKKDFPEKICALFKELHTFNKFLNSAIDLNLNK